jgi:hypothetical protein
MNINGAVSAINASNLSGGEKSHLRRLVRKGEILPAAFEGIPDFNEILNDFPLGKSSPPLIFIPI